MKDIKIKGFKSPDLHKAIGVARAFSNEFSDRKFGFYHGVGYAFTNLKAYAYQTKTAIVVVADYGETE